MVASAEVRERSILESLRERYEREGYSFYVYPPREVVPSFLGSYRPDAIAKRDDEGVVIEIKARTSPRTDMRLSEIAALFSGHPRWRFQIVNIEAHEGDQVIETYPRNTIEQELEKAGQLRQVGQLRAAFVLLWGALEAAARSLLVSELQGNTRPMLPGQIAEMLASNGLIDQEAAKTLRSLSRLRNAVVHGDLGVEVDQNAFASLNNITQSLLGQLRASG